MARHAASEWQSAHGVRPVSWQQHHLQLVYVYLAPKGSPNVASITNFSPHRKAPHAHMPFDGMRLAQVQG